MDTLCLCTNSFKSEFLYLIKQRGHVYFLGWGDVMTCSTDHVNRDGTQKEGVTRQATEWGGLLHEGEMYACQNTFPFRSAPEHAIE